MHINNELKNYFRINLVIAIVLFLGSVAYYLLHQISGQSPILERYGIILTLGGIWGALKLFHWQTKKLDTADIETYKKKYKQSYLLRLGILDIILLFNISSLLITGARNFLFLAGIIIFGYLFCIPTPIKETEENEN